MSFVLCSSRRRWRSNSSKALPFADASFCCSVNPTVLLLEKGEKRREPKSMRSLLLPQSLSSSVGAPPAKATVTL